MKTKKLKVVDVNIYHAIKRFQKIKILLIWLFSIVIYCSNICIVYAQVSCIECSNTNAPSIGTSLYSTAIGEGSVVDGHLSFAIGINAQANNTNCFAIGHNAITESTLSYAIGPSSSIGINSDRSFALGHTASIIASLHSYAIGNLTENTNSNSAYAIGDEAKNIGTTGSPSAYAIGRGAENNNSPSSYSIGNTATTKAEDSYAIGNSANTEGESSYAIGNNATTNEDYSYAIGRNTTTNGLNSYAIGTNAIANNHNSYAIGNGALTNALRSYAIGYGSEAKSDNSYAIGNGAIANGESSYALGNGSITNGINSYAIGYQLQTDGNNSFVIGNDIEHIQTNNSFSIGNNIYSAVYNNTFSFGNYISVIQNNAFVIGSGIDNTNRLINQTPNSLIIGFSDKPMFFLNDNIIGLGNFTQPVGQQPQPPFIVDSDGDLVRINNVPYTWPTSGAVNRVLSIIDDGTGVLELDWVLPLTSGIGSGIENYVARWINGGNDLTYGLIYDDGTDHLVIGLDPSLGPPSIQIPHPDFGFEVFETDVLFRSENFNVDPPPFISNTQFEVWKYNVLFKNGLFEVRDNNVQLNNSRFEVNDNFVLFNNSNFVVNNGSVVFNGITGNTPVSGAGTRMMWIPEKGAFRAGRVTGTKWDDLQIGDYSFAAGYNTEATGERSTAIGSETNASGYASFSSGFLTVASGPRSFATGYETLAEEENSFATGYQTVASGNASFSAGYNTNSSGWRSFATGHSTIASGNNSFAAGRETIASGNTSIAWGKSYMGIGEPPSSGWRFTEASGSEQLSLAFGGNVVAQHNGSFVLGDVPSEYLTGDYWHTASFNENQITMRFKGIPEGEFFPYTAYTFYTNDGMMEIGEPGAEYWVGTTPTGVYMLHEQSGWASFSDRSMKTNIQELNDIDVLDALKNIPVTEWSYKGTNPDTRYIGPMAQDFYKAFKLGGKDSLGINTVNISGVNMAGIKALINRTDLLEEKLDTLLNYPDLTELEETVAQQEEEIIRLKEELEVQNQRLNSLEGLVHELYAYMQTCGPKSENCQLPEIKPNNNNNSGELNSPSWIDQNIPNPFNEDAVINYYIASDVSHANISVYDMNGKLVMSSDISESGHGQFNINASGLAPATYIYKFTVNGKFIGEHKMVIQR